MKQSFYYLCSLLCSKLFRKVECMRVKYTF